MAEYIDREAVLERLQIRLPGIDIASECINHVMDVCCDEIKKHPAADVEEVKHGRWIEQNISGEQAWCCSECKTLGSLQWKRCPVCETKMDGGKENVQGEG